MYKVMVVDDNKSTVKEIEAGIKEQIPDVNLYVAHDVANAMAIIQDAYQRNAPFGVAILDFMLPLNENATEATFDDTLCSTIRQRMPGTLVVHITSYPNDSQVVSHVGKYHGEGPWNPPMKLLNKLDISYVTELMPLLKRYLYSSQVESMLDELFGGRSVPAGGLRLSGGYGASRSHRSYTHRLMTAEGEISARWKDLDEATQERVKEIFFVNSSGGGVEVSLLDDRQKL